jgi:hypothetical protein
MDCSLHALIRVPPTRSLELFAQLHVDGTRSGPSTINRRSSYFFGIRFLTSTFLLLFTFPVYKFIDSISYFPSNSTKDELRITLNFWQIEGVQVKNRILPEFQDFLLSRSLVPEKNVSFYAHWVSKFLVFSNRNEGLHVFPSSKLSVDPRNAKIRRHLATTMIYTHAASKNILGVRSPLDR